MDHSRSNSASATIYIYDQIGQDFWGEGIGASDFVSDLNDLGAVSEINLHINSPGGSIFDGVAIYNSLVNHSAKVNVKIDGLAASIASVIAMAGDHIEIAENGMMMIHDPWNMVMGGSEDMRKEADLLDQLKNSIVGTYARRTERDRGELGQMMTDETWMDGLESVAEGFADDVSAPIRAAAHFPLESMGFCKVPENAQPWEEAEDTIHAGSAPLVGRERLADLRKFARDVYERNG